MDETHLYFLILSLPTVLIVGILARRGRGRQPAPPSGALGLLRSTHGKAYRSALAGGCFLLLTGVFPLMIGLAWVPDSDGWLLAAMGLAIALSGSQVVWRALVDRSIRIDQYTDGLMYHHRHTVTMIPWSAIDAIKRHDDLRTYALILYTVPAGRIDLAGMHDGRSLTDAVLAAVACHRGAAAWNSMIYGSEAGDPSILASPLVLTGADDHHSQVNPTERMAPASLGERIFNVVGFMLTLALWIAPWILFWPPRPEHLLSGVTGLALGIIASSRHAGQWDWQMRRRHEPPQTVPRSDRMGIMVPLAVAAGGMTARYGLVEHLLGQGLTDVLFIFLTNGLCLFLIYLQIQDWRSA